MPGRKSVIYFTWGMYLTPELDVPFHNLISTAIGTTSPSTPSTPAA